jgi:hypothetical protein
MKARTPMHERHRIIREMDARSRLCARLSRQRDEAAERHGNTVAELHRAVQEHQAATDAHTRAALADRVKRLAGLAERQRAAITDTEAEMARVKAAYEDWAKHLPTTR